MMMQEIWVEHPCDKMLTKFKKIEVSNFGRLKIYSELFPEGKITTGNLVNGVPTFTYKVYKPLSETDAQKMNDVDTKFQQARALVTKLRYQPEKLEEAKKIRNKLREDKKKLNRRITKKRERNVVLLIHRLVAEHFLEKPIEKDKVFVIHKDFDKTNNHVENLAWASQDEISARHSQQPKLVLHKFKMQLYNIPREPRHMKLSESDVLYIKKRLQKNDSIERLAARFSVHPLTIKRIQDGKSWTHVKLVEELLEERK